MARTTKSPALDGVHEQFALPNERFPVVQSALFEASLKATTPVAPDVTDAVKVTAVPNAGDADEVMKEVVVFAVFIVRVAEFEFKNVSEVEFALVFVIVTL
jgi:hypothetical protein